MPKKFKGENSKAAEARARKSAAREEENARKLKAAEDEYWRDDDKHVAKKQQRKEDKEKKRLEQLERKQAAQKLLDEEMSSMKPSKAPVSAKVTRAEIAAHQKQEAAAVAAAAKAQQETVVTELPLEENLNRVETEGEARTVEDAISVLSVKEDKGIKHPEKKVKAAYEEYEKKNLPILKAENPNLRLSQLKQMLKKDWMKSPENPLNMRTRAYNEK